MPAPLRSALLPTWAVFEADLARAARSWIVRAWCLLFALQGFFTVLDNANRQADGAREIVTSQIAVPLIRIHVVVWSSFIILVGALGLTAEAGSLADGVLSRGINRYQYFLAKLAAAYKGLPELVYAARAVAFGESPTDEAIQRLDAASEYYAETFPWEDEPETPA